MTPEVLYVCEYVKPSVKQTLVQSKKHTHDHPELSIILEGTASYMINGQPVTLTKGDIVLFKAHVPHSVFLESQGYYRDLHIGINHLLDSFDAKLNALPNDYVLLNFLSEKKDFLPLCETVIEESRLGKKECQAMILGVTLQLFVRLLRIWEDDTSTIQNTLYPIGYPDKAKVVALITEYIEQNYMNDISLEMFAKNMYLSQVYISKIFKEETGSSPINYLIKTRLSKAKDLLEEEGLPIKVVSYQVGYHDAYHFSKLFKKYYGYAPSAVKKSNPAVS